MPDEPAKQAETAADAELNDKIDAELVKLAGPTDPLTTPDGKAAENGFQRLIKKLDPVLAKTVLDMDAVRVVLNKPRGSVEEKLKEVQSRPAAPIKPKLCFDDYREATPCSSRWESMEGTERFKICTSCKLHVYDFEELDLPEIKETVLVREGKMYSTLYRRADGKFITQDCPVGVKQKHSTVTLILLAALALVAVGIATLTAPPRPASAPQADQSETQAETPQDQSGPPAESPAAQPGTKSTTSTGNSSASPSATTSSTAAASNAPKKPQQPFYTVPVRKRRPR